MRSKEFNEKNKKLTKKMNNSKLRLNKYKSYSTTPKSRKTKVTRATVNSNHQNLSPASQSKANQSPKKAQKQRNHSPLESGEFQCSICHSPQSINLINDDKFILIIV